MKNIDKLNKAMVGLSDDRIKEVLDFLGYKEDDKFSPKSGEKYWLVDAGGWVNDFIWENDRVDEYQLSLGNVYKTREEAAMALDFQTRKANLIKEIEDSSEVIDWESGRQSKYSISYSHADGSVSYGSWNTVQYQGMVYTTNSQFLEDLIVTREDEVKELLFDIK